MSKGGGGSDTVTQRTEIPAFLQPFVQRQAEIGTGALENLQGQLQGAGADELVSPFTPAQLQAQQGALDIAGGAGGFIPTAQQEFLQTAQGRDLSSFLDPTALSALQQTAGGDFLFGGQGFDQAVDAALRAAQPSILSTFGGAGRGTGGLAQTAISQAATDAFARQFGQERQNQLAAAGALGGFGESERARQLQAAGLLPGLGLLPSDIQSQIGGQQQAQAQRELLAPISAQESLLAAAGGGIPLQSLLGQAQTGPGQSGNLGGTLLGLGSLAGGLGSLGGLFGGGAAAGGAAGGIGAATVAL